MFLDNWEDSRYRMYRPRSPNRISRPSLQASRVRAAFTAASCRPAAPFVRTAFWAAPRRFAFPRRYALLWAWRESASCAAAAVPPPSRAWGAARDRVGFGLRPVACGAIFPGGGGSFTPARLALDSPMAITCLAERAPCLPSRTCSTSWRTYSPACADGDLAFRACRGAFFSGWLKSTAAMQRHFPVVPIGSDAVVPGHLRSPGGIGHIGPIAFVKTRSLL